MADDRVATEAERREMLEELRVWARLISSGSDLMLAAEELRSELLKAKKAQACLTPPAEKV